MTRPLDAHLDQPYVTPALHAEALADDREFTWARRIGFMLCARPELTLAAVVTRLLNVDYQRALREDRSARHIRTQPIVAPQLNRRETVEAGRPSVDQHVEVAREDGAREALLRVRAELGDRHCAHDITIANVARAMGVTL